MNGQRQLRVEARLPFFSRAPYREAPGTPGGSQACFLCEKDVGQSGFTLVEMIGVLAVIAILAAALFPVLIRRIDMATKQQESGNLVAISNALSWYTIRNAAVPTVAAWTNSVTSWSGFAAGQAVANSRRYTRYYFTQQSASPAVNGVTSRPTVARALIVSTLGGSHITAADLSYPL